MIWSAKSCSFRAATSAVSFGSSARLGERDGLPVAETVFQCVVPVVGAARAVPVARTWCGGERDCEHGFHGGHCRPSLLCKLRPYRVQEIEIRIELTLNPLNSCILDLSSNVIIGS